MQQYLKELKERRMRLLAMTEPLTVKEYNLIPFGFNNNIIWNMGHMLLVSEKFLYRNTTYDTPVHAFETALFTKCSKPEQAVNDYGISLIRQALAETIPVFETKCLAKKDTENITDTHLLYSSVSEASLQFVIFHENMHFHTIEKILAKVTGTVVEYKGKSEIIVSDPSSI